MTRKVFNEAAEEGNVMYVADELPRVKQFVRYIGARTTESAQAIQEVDEEINAWLAQGYRLLSTHYIEHNTIENTFGVLYVLFRE